MKSEFKILPIEEKYINGFREAVGSVAREKKYISFLDAPSLEMSREFVMENIHLNRPHFVAMCDGRIVGWCDIASMHRPVFSHAGTLGIGVTQPFRGRGIGRALLQAAIVKAKEIGLTRVELTVREGNAAAISLYKSMGFEVEGIHKNAVCINGCYENHVCMAVLFG